MENRTPHWYPLTLYFLLFWVVILLPLEFQWPEPLGSSLLTRLASGELDDTATLALTIHALLFFPLGIVAHGYARKRSARFLCIFSAAALLLATLSELAQLFVNHRGPSSVDVISDLAGFALGYFAARAIGQVRQLQFLETFVHSSSIPVVSTLSLGLLVAYLLGSLDTTISNWDRTFPLLVANENTGDRPWQGELYEIAIFDRAIGEGRARRLSSPAAHLNQPLGEEAIIHYLFAAPYLELEEGAVVGVEEVSHRLAPVKLKAQAIAGIVPLAQQGIRIEEGARLVSEHPPTRVYESLLSTGAFSLIVRFKAKDSTASGPARILSLSVDPHRRNFTLGQDGDSLHFRVRNSLAGANGTRPALIGTGCVRPGRIQTAVATYTSRSSRLVVDGNDCGCTAFTLFHWLVSATSVSRPTLPAKIGVLFCGWALLSLSFFAILGGQVATQPWREISASILATAMLAALASVHLTVQTC